MKKIQVIGNITRDCAVRQIQGNPRKAISFNVAENEKYTNKNGEKINKVTYFSCTYWREDTEKISPYLVKGAKVYVEGSPSVYQYEKQDTHEVIAVIQITIEKLELLGGKPQNEQGAAPAKAAPQKSGEVNKPTTPAQNSNTEWEDTLTPTPDDDLPF